jgi:tetratricopeptide (TPR) repeat protein
MGEVATATTVAGSILSVVTQQIIYLSLPLSFSLVFTMLSFRQKDQQIQTSQENISELRQDISRRVQEVEKVHQESISELRQDISRHVQEIEKVCAALKNKQAKLQETDQILAEIQSYSQQIQMEPKVATLYYERGLKYQALENIQGAIADFNQAIRLDPTLAKAYYQRGLLGSILGDRKGAIEDFRTASKHFFAQGDLQHYQAAKEKSLAIHDLKSENSLQVPEVLADVFFG